MQQGAHDRPEAPAERAGAVVGAGLLWGYMYGREFGTFTQLAEHMGPANPDFLSAGHLLPSIANVVAWEFTGYNMITLYAALPAIPGELYEAAALDGAGPVRAARNGTHGTHGTHGGTASASRAGRSHRPAGAPAPGVPGRSRRTWFTTTREDRSSAWRSTGEPRYANVRNG
ncbi:sugar ABC transporter permease [Streptomyces humi]|uniref:carbohydrate ABC transporter permease n=1 Tax=Streptomyces humi TaxID=1428620 RepID=UPI0006287A86